jgi:hypothetical protein
MATKTEKILIGIDDQVIELTGADKEEFIAMRAEMQKQEETRKTELESEKQLKIEAYTKLGLTTEEIKSIV